MSINPSMIKQLLQLQMLQRLDSFSGAGSSLAEGAGSDFAELLGGLLNETVQPSASKVIPASELLARSQRSAASAYQSVWKHTQETGKPSSGYEGFIERASSRNGVDSALVKAVIQAESNYNPKAVSPAGAKGLMQLMDGTAQGLGVKDSFDPQQNIEGGTRFLGELLKKYNGSEGVALAAYNAGPGRVDRLGIRNDADLREKLSLLPKETQKYVAKVLGLKEQYRSQA